MANPNGWFKAGNKYGKGRPKGSGCVQLCRKVMEEGGWQRLFDMAMGKPINQRAFLGKDDGYGELEIPADVSLQHEALKTILAYGYGKPTERFEIEDTTPKEEVPTDIALNIVNGH